MSMDDVYVRARELAQRLEKFNDRLRAAMVDVDHCHSQVSPLWNDTMRRDYDRRWLPLAEKIKEYNQQVGPRYQEFLVRRLHHLMAYLHGHGQ